MKHIMIYLDLFSGTGGFALGLLNAGFNLKKHYFCEKDKYAIANYKYNFNEAEYVGKIEEISDNIERPNIVTFGFPCQDLSFAGKQKGINGKKSNLFFHAIKIIRKYKPEFFLFENVKGLLSSNRGRDFYAVLETIAQLGIYECEWQLINSSWFLPQNRERVYFIGYTGKRTVKKIFPIKESFPEIYSEQKKSLKYDQFDFQSNKQNSCYQRIYNIKGISPTIVTGGKIKINFGDEIRRLTPLELERLQGLPDNWTGKGILNEKVVALSDRQRYILTGNGVSVPVIEEIAKSLLLFKNQ